MAVEFQLGKLPAPEGHPGSRLVPGVTECQYGRKARNKGVSAESAAESSGRKSGVARAESGTSLPKWHPSRAIQMPKKPGKTGLSAEKIGCRLGKLSLCENRRWIVTEIKEQTEEKFRQDRRG